VRCIPQRINGLEKKGTINAEKKGRKNYGVECEGKMAKNGKSVVKIIRKS
jgi:hypothetical protein